MEVQRFYWDEEGAHIQLQVLERNSGVPIILNMNEQWGLASAAMVDEDARLHALEAFLNRVISHEIRELLLYKGRRRDPHAEFGR